MDVKNLNPELYEKARSCKTPDELIKLAEEEGVNLSDEQLEGISASGIDWKCGNDSCLTWNIVTM